MKLTNIEKILGGQKVLTKSIHNKIDLIELSNIGVTKKALLHLTDYLNIPIGKATEFFPITARTIQRYAPDEHFNRTVSEQILQIAELAARGSEVFGDRKKFLQWMNMPIKAFANRTPFSLIGSKFGVEMVLDELGRIEYGVFS